MSDPETMAVYAEAAERYVSGVARAKSADEEIDLTGMVDALPAGSRVLDLGCGPGHWSARMIEAGLITDAVDASPEMAALAKSEFGVDVRIETFDTLTLNGPYDGVWANFSLLHAPRADMAGHLKRLHQETVPGGRLHLGMKLGKGEKRDDLGRLFTYYQENELCTLVEAAGFHVQTTRRGHGSGLSGVPDTYIIVTAHA
ncbi:class I SAM-dependent methyltransferase [uncultured Shimia sp.]|uniref:class I SAM-dependent methyltransferase n=1 Tax=uncultured Shimia sp. TaxID=573152 RepID=UPI0026020BF5|nr:class I SAM-dependent methyltransferase [uncultured Shimia sp.]